MALTVAGASKRFGSTRALDCVNLSVAQGTVCALVGANGSGKSTLIRALAGYHMLDAGVVHLHGQELNSHRMAEQGKAAGLRFVHQDLALIPNLTIADNLAMERVTSSMRLEASTGGERRIGCDASSTGSASAWRLVSASPISARSIKPWSRSPVRWTIWTAAATS